MNQLLGWVGIAIMGVAMRASAAEPWTLERALEQAFEHNSDARLAQSRIQEAQAGLEQARAAFWPHLRLQSSYTRTDNPMLTFGSILNQRAYQSSLDFNAVPDMDNLNVRGLITVPLYSGGANKAGREAARAGSEARKQSREAVLNSLGFEVVRSFHAVLKSKQLIAAVENMVRALEENLTVAKRRLEGGNLLKSDVLDLEVRLAQGREDLVRARNGRVLAELTLRNLLGVEGGDFTVADTAPAAKVPEGADFSDRPEIAGARELELAAEAELRQAKSGYQPRVNAFGSVDRDSGWITGGEGNSYTAGVMVQWDLWDGLSTRAKTRAARARLDATREEQRKLRQALTLEREQAQLDLQAARERLAVTDSAIRLAAQSANLIRSRFEQGLALSTQVIDSEAALMFARVRRAEAENDHEVAVASLRKALALPQLDRLSNRK